jgi:hypothetical protein
MIGPNPENSNPKVLNIGPRSYRCTESTEDILEARFFWPGTSPVRHAFICPRVGPTRISGTCSDRKLSTAG